MPQSQPLFIFGSPRSGTPLLQRLLNSYEDVIIWGEHHGMLAPLSQAYYDVKEGKQSGRGVNLPSVFKHPRFGPQQPLPPENNNWSRQHWLHWFDEEEWKREFKNFISGIFYPNGFENKNFWGFKEVSYGVNCRTLEFLKELYENAIFVFIVRNGFNVLASQKQVRINANWQGGLLACRQICRQWVKQTRNFRDWHAANKNQSHWIVYEDLIQGQGEMTRLLESMNKTLGEKQSRLLSEKHGRGSSFQDEAYRERWRSLPASWLAIGQEIVREENRQRGFLNPPTSWGLVLWGKLLLAGLFLTDSFGRRKGS